MSDEEIDKIKLGSVIHNERGEVDIVIAIREPGEIYEPGNKLTGIYCLITTNITDHVAEYGIEYLTHDYVGLLYE